MTALDKMKNLFMKDQGRVYSLIVDSTFSDKFEKHVLEECRKNIMEMTQEAIHDSIDELFSEEDAAAIIKVREELQPKTELLSKILQEKFEAFEPAINKLLEDTYTKHTKD